MINKILKHPFFIFFVTSIIVSLLVYLLLTIFKYEKMIEQDIFKISTSDVLQITDHKALYIKDILKDSDNYINEIKTDEKLRLNLEKYIHNLITDNIKYSYILYKDNHDVFRFLVDGSEENEKSALNQKFDIGNNKWFEVYEKKEPLIIKHDVYQKLYISYLVPIMNEEKVELLLVIDFSVKKIEKINQIIIMMKSGLVLTLVIIAIFLLVLVYQFIKYKSIKKSSYTDSLTKVYNRNYLHDIENKISLNNYILGVLDIDNFKNINDTYGHDIGDVILREVGTILLNTIRTDEDITIRYGGEEFVILTKTKSDNNEMSLSVIQRIFETIKNHKMYINDKDYINITVSIGINMLPGESKSFLEAFKLADLALYEAKHNGRDRIEIHNK